MQFKKIHIDIVADAPLLTEKNGQPKEFMSVDHFQQIATNLRAYTDTLAFSMFNDSLYHPEFDQILEIVSKLNYRCSIATSSLLLIKHLELCCVNSSLYQVDIPLQGLLDHHALDSKEDQIALFEAIVGLNGCNVSISLLINQKDALLLDSRIVEFMAQFDIICSPALWDKGNRVALDHHLFLQLKQERHISDLDTAKTIGRCYGTVTMLGCMADGSIIPCNQPAGKQIILGNNIETPIHIILSDPLFQQINEGFYKNHLDHPVCQHCPYPRTYF